MARRLPGAAVVVASAFVLAPSLPLAQAPPAQRLSIQIVNIKPEAFNDWVALQQNETIPALKKVGVAMREAWASTFFGDGFQYLIVQPITKYAEYDDPQAPMVRALGEVGARAYNDKLRRMIVGQRTLAVGVLPESVIPPASYERRFIVLNFSYVVPGRSSDYLSYLRNEFLPAIRKGKPVGYAATRTLYGGDANEFVTTRYIEKMAELDGPNVLQQAIGVDAAAQLNAKAIGMVDRQERRIYRYVPALSIRASGSNQQ